jgi:hypothetical protein
VKGMGLVRGMGLAFITFKNTPLAREYHYKGAKTTILKTTSRQNSKQNRTQIFTLLFEYLHPLE